MLSQLKLLALLLISFLLGCAAAVKNLDSTWEADKTYSKTESLPPLEVPPELRENPHEFHPNPQAKKPVPPASKSLTSERDEESPIL